MPSQPVLMILRGEALRSFQSSCLTQQNDPRMSGSPTHGPAASPAVDDCGTIDGVPLAAAQHCCGRGCKHCRFYWRQMKA